MCERDYKRFLAVQREVFRNAFRLARTYGRLKKAYRDQYLELVSDAAWKERFTS
jgi:hypothetical protein